MTIVITTFSKDGYELYGHRMIETWIQYWPQNYKLVVYVEDYSITEKDHRIQEIKIDIKCANLLEFKKKSQLLLNQATDKREISRIQKTVKWSHKVYIIDHALKNFDATHFIFLDGDTYTTAGISETLASDLVKNHLLAVHFESIKNYPLHFETGLIVFNTQHRQIELFKNIYVAGYDNLEIYNLEKTWDSFWLVRLFKEYNLDILDLSKGKLSSVFGNPMIYKKIVHDVGTKKYRIAGYNKFTGKKS